jgi:hypothetical protein
VNVINLAIARERRDAARNAAGICYTEQVDFVRAISPCGNFTLIQRPRASNSAWTNFKLARNINYGRRTWYLGWNGVRLARSWDLQDLEGRHPEIVAWLWTVLQTRPNAA